MRSRRSDGGSCGWMTSTSIRGKGELRDQPPRRRGERRRAHLKLGEALEIYVRSASREVRVGGGVRDAPPDKPIAASMRANAHRYLLLLAGLGLDAALFRIVAGRVQAAAPPGRGEGGAGALRRAHRAAEPHDVPRRRRTRRCWPASATRPGRRDAHGPRPLQGRQRHARPPQRRPAAPAQLGSRLRGVLRNSATVARLGGDEFGVLLPRRPATRRPPSSVAEVLEGAARSRSRSTSLALESRGEHRHRDLPGARRRPSTR